MLGIPPAKDTDVEDVVWGLQTAEALWKRGERGDALVWLRRAAQAAGDASDDDRALELARLAAELSEWMASAAAAPPAPPPVASAPAPPQAPSFPPPEEARPHPPAPRPPSNPTMQTAQPDFDVHAAPTPEAPPVEVTEDVAVEPEPAQTISVPPAEQVHAGMFDPWDENALPGPAPKPVSVSAVPASPAAEDEEEVFTSARPQAPRSEGAPRAPEVSLPPVPKPPPVPSAKPKPPPLPPRARASAPKPPVPRAAASSDALPAAPPAAPPSDESVLTSASRMTPPPASPTQEIAMPAVGSAAGAEAAPAEPAPPEPAPAEIAAAESAPPEPAPPEPAPPEPAPPEPAAPEPSAPEPAQPRIDLEDVEAFADLPDDARAAFAAAATRTVLGEGEEVSHFALAYLLEGSFDVAATVVDAPAVRLERGAVLRARGTTDEGVPMRLICAGQSGVVATWSDADVEEAFRTCPWVEEDLRVSADRVLTLVGITIGPLGERLDPSIREEIVGRLTMRPLRPGEIVVEAGAPVPGLLLVGVGELELVAGDAVSGTVGSGEFLFAGEVLGAGAAPATARAGAGGALVMFGDRKIAQELLVTCPPLLEVFAGM